MQQQQAPPSSSSSFHNSQRNSSSRQSTDYKDYLKDDRASLHDLVGGQGLKKEEYIKYEENEEGQDRQNRGDENERDSSNAPTTKKRKVDERSSSTKKAKIKVLKNDNAESYLELSDTRRVTIQTYRGRRLVQIREYYKDKTSGEMRPGKSGIALTEDQWNLLKDMIPYVDAEL